MRFRMGRGGQLALTLLTLVASLDVALATPPRSPISIGLKLSGLEEGLSRGDVIIDVATISDAPGTHVELILPPGIEAPVTRWLVDLKPGPGTTLTTTWVATGSPGNVTVSARAGHKLGPGESWGDMASVPMHIAPSNGIVSEGWKVDQIPLATLAQPGDAVIMSTDPIPFQFPDLSGVPAPPRLSWPVTDAAAEAGPLPPPETAATVTLTGHWGYPDRSGVLRDVDQQLLEIRRGDGAALNPRIFCFTDPAGSYSCSFPHPGTSFRVWLRSWSNFSAGPTRLGVFSGIEVSGGCGSDSVDCTYANSTPEIFCADGATCNVGSWNVPGGAEPWLGAHQMTQDLIRSWKRSFFDHKDPPGSHGGPAKITWPTPPNHGIHCHAFDEGSENSGDPWISIRPPFQTAPDVVLHEYGHAVMDNMWFAFAPNWSNDDCPSPHYIDGVSGAGCALSEGFADFWSWYSNEFFDGDADPANNGPVYNDPGFSVNFETRDSGPGFFQHGPYVEGNVAGVFGDLLDAANEGRVAGLGAADRVTDGINHVWHTLYAQSLQHFGHWFHTYWSVYGHDPGPALEVLYHNTINYGFLLNDTCVNARAVAGTPYARTDDTSIATTDSTDPGVTCGNGSRGRSAFYRWTAPAPGVVTADTFGSSYDTILSAHAGACGSLGSIACNDDTGGLQSRISALVAPGQTVTFMASAFNDDGGTLDFQLNFAPSAPGNDLCGSPTVIPGTPFTHTAYTLGATASAGDPNPPCGNGSNSRSVWYRYTAPADGTLSVDTNGSGYDTILAAWTGACGSLLQVPGGCSDNAAPPGTWSRINVAVAAGQSYLLQASALKNDGGTLILNATFAPGAPPNDTCGAALEITGGSFAVSESTLGAAGSPGDSGPSCGNGSRGKNVWFHYTAPASGMLTIHTQGSSYDTILEGYTGPCGSLVPVPGSCSDDFSPPQRWSRIDIPVTAGAGYTFQVSAYNNDGGTLALTAFFTPPVPANDTCATATVVPSYPFGDVTYTLGATAGPGDPAPLCGNGSNAAGVWYRFTAPASGLLLLDTSGSDYDTILSVWSGPCGAQASVGCNDDAGGLLQSQLAIATLPLQTYDIMVSSFSGSGGTLGFSLDFLADSGHVPDGYAFPGAPLQVSQSGGTLNLTWGSSCVPSDGDYEVYEGALGSYYSHAPILCSTSGATSASFVPAGYSTYYLVVPRSAQREGSLGLDSSGSERPQGAGACLPQAIGGCITRTARAEHPAQ